MPILSEEDLERFRTKVCTLASSMKCDFGVERCNYSHNLYWARRCPFYLRDSSILRYIPTCCPDVELGEGTTVLRNTCPRGNNCSFAHSLEEIHYHPLVYKTEICKDYRLGKCKTYYCHLVHGLAEFRVPRQYVLPKKNGLDIPPYKYVTMVENIRSFNGGHSSGYYQKDRVKTNAKLDNMHEKGTWTSYKWNNNHSTLDKFYTSEISSGRDNSIESTNNICSLQEHLQMNSSESECHKCMENMGLRSLSERKAKNAESSIGHDWYKLISMPPKFNYLQEKYDCNKSLTPEHNSLTLGEDSYYSNTPHHDSTETSAYNGNLIDLTNKIAKNDSVVIRNVELWRESDLCTLMEGPEVTYMDSNSMRTTIAHKNEGCNQFNLTELGSNSSDSITLNSMYKNVIKQCDNIKEKCETFVTGTPVTWLTIVKETDKLWHFVDGVKSFLYGQVEDSSVTETYTMDKNKDTKDPASKNNALENSWTDWSAIYTGLLENTEQEEKTSDRLKDESDSKSTNNCTVNLSNDADN